MDLRRWLIAGRLLTTWPARRAELRRAEREGRCPVALLFYHRVANTEPNDWTISCDLFEQQMMWLKDHVDLVSLAEAQARIRSGRNHRLAVSVTFDDGYADNCDFAIPLLLSEKIPCTYFVSTHPMLERQPFPHDVERGVPLQPNTPEQILAMADAGIEIGAHTRSHLNFAGVTDAQILQDEIGGSAEDLASLLGRPIRYFAVPYGQTAQVTPQVIQAARDCGYEGVVSAHGGYNQPGQDPFLLKRIHGDPEMWRFWNWLTLDTRKVRLHEDSSEPSTQSAPQLQEVGP